MGHESSCDDIVPVARRIPHVFVTRTWQHEVWKGRDRGQQRCAARTTLLLEEAPMGIWAVLLLVAVAIVIGIAAQVISQAGLELEWIVVAIGAGLGGFVASEWLGAASTWGPEVDGLFILPALIGAIVVGVIVDLVFRTTSPERSAQL